MRMTAIKVKFRPASMGHKEGTIYYQIIHDRKARQLSTKYHIMAEEWDYSRSMVTAGRDDDRAPLVLSIRKKIHCDVERLNRIDRRLDANGIAYTAEDIVEEFRRHEREYSLSNFMKSLIVKFKQNGKTRTSETYAATLRSFRNFLVNRASMGYHHQDENLTLDCLSPELLEAYEAWLRAKGNSLNTASFYLRILRAVYNRAVEDEIIENRYPFRRVYTGIDKTAKRALPLPTIKKIKALDLSATPLLEYARDMFMMSFYLRGMSFIDMAYLKKTDLKNGSITYRRRKTGRQITIGWTREMQSLLDKYPENPTQYLLPIIKTTGCNERCVYRNASYNINRTLKMIAGMVGVQMPLTMYVARHSWASAAKTKGIPLSVISEGMGHDSETTTQIYLAALDTSAVDQANDLILSSL